MPKSEMIYWMQPMLKLKAALERAANSAVKLGAALGMSSTFRNLDLLHSGVLDHVQQGRFSGVVPSDDQIHRLDGIKTLWALTKALEVFGLNRKVREFRHLELGTPD